MFDAGIAIMETQRERYETTSVFSRSNPASFAGLRKKKQKKKKTGNAITFFARDLIQCLLFVFFPSNLSNENRQGFLIDVTPGKQRSREIVR